MKPSVTIRAVGTPKNVQLSTRKPSSANRVRPYHTRKISRRSPGTSRELARRASQISTIAPAIPDSDSYRNSGWKCVVSGYVTRSVYGATRWAASILIPHGRVVGGPYSSWLKKLPQRPIACMTNRAGAIASAHCQTGSWLRRA